MPYRTLDADRIEATLETLYRRIEERFPNRGLANLCKQLLEIAREDKRKLAWVQKPNLWLRSGVFLAMALGAAGMLWFIVSLRNMTVQAEAFNALQGIDAAVNTVALSGAASWFLLNVESIWRRRAVLRDLHELRSIAHVVDMHQLTKDPTVLLGGGGRTPSSPDRRMTRFELTRYLEYCAEMLALTGKLSALYAGESHDHVVIAAASDVENLCTDLGRKIWQKITILGDLAEG